MLLEEGVCYDKCILLAKHCNTLPCFILYSKAKLAWYSLGISLLPTFALQFPVMKRTSFLVLVLVGLVDFYRTFRLELL